MARRSGRILSPVTMPQARRPRTTQQRKSLDEARADHAQNRLHSAGDPPLDIDGTWCYASQASHCIIIPLTVVFCYVHRGCCEGRERVGGESSTRAPAHRRRATGSGSGRAVVGDRGWSSSARQGGRGVLHRRGRCFASRRVPTRRECRRWSDRGRVDASPITDSSGSWIVSAPAPNANRRTRTRAHSSGFTVTQRPCAAV